MNQSNLPDELQEKPRLAPLVFLITEEDGAVFEWIIRNKNKLREMGYKHINLEQSCDEPIDSLLIKCDVITAGREAILAKPEKKALDAETTQWYMGLKNYPYILGMSNLLKNLADEWPISFIDIPAAEILKNPGQSPELIAPLEALKAKREKKFADEIVESSHSNNGGTITIIGSNHHTVDREIQKLDPQLMSSALFIALSQFHPYVAPIEPVLLEMIDQHRKSS
ncbi:MAG: hypothetical protein K2X39_04555, partial [Silvanigrellaceae bacterium]|nr:hypothetical protein [Silvanigrellaceae bacterium]